MDQVSVNLFISELFHEFPEGGLAKVIKIITREGVMIEKYALSFVNGEWIQIKEDERCPDECILHR